jgi:hypothetical protein
MDDNKPLTDADVAELNAMAARLAAEPLPVEGGNRTKKMKKRSRRQKK